ncbi:metal-dependent hydrolase [Salinicola tamaricis]|uniref:metal-dependent hydrolase n=1 Tax=Salinicola tamaricis TaxID=1771309 RepID=UPI002414535B|nr:metal-dependent hydrolase [Salinicola tamaricis]
MANFRTHFGVASVGGLIASQAGWQASLYGLWQAAAITGLVTFGGILPDIDADNSRAVRLIFQILALIAIVVAVLLLQHRVTPAQLFAACGATYLAVRYLASALFARFTVHRGLWHSLLAAALSGLATAAASFTLLGSRHVWPGCTAWRYPRLSHPSGAGRTLQRRSHRARFKRSFGTALKPFDWKAPGSSLMLLLTSIHLIAWLPPLAVLREVLTQGWGGGAKLPRLGASRSTLRGQSPKERPHASGLRRQ